MIAGNEPMVGVQHLRSADVAQDGLSNHVVLSYFYFSVNRLGLESMWTENSRGGGQIGTSRLWSTESGRSSELSFSRQIAGKSDSQRGKASLGA